MKKRLLSLTMAACMLCLLTLTSCSAAEVPASESSAEPLAVDITQTVSFSDVPADAWYAEAVAYCQQYGIMSGISAATFEPEGTMTRAMPCLPPSSTV